MNNKLKGNHEKIFLFLILLVMLASCNTNKDLSEDITFTVQSQIEDSLDNSVKTYFYHAYRIEDDLNPHFLCSSDYNIKAYGDSFFFIVCEPEEKKWEIRSMAYDGSNEKTIYSCDDETIFPSNYEIFFFDDFLYISVDKSDFEQNGITQTLLFRIQTGGTNAEFLSKINVAYSLFTVDKGYLYYCDKETMFPVQYSLSTGEATILADVSVYRGIFAFSREALWFLEKQEERGSTSIYLCNFQNSVLNRVETDMFASNDYNLYFYNDWVFYYKKLPYNAETQELSAKLYMSTGLDKEGTLIATITHYNANFPPTLVFGKNGLVLINTFFSEDSLQHYYQYVSYTGGFVKNLNIETNGGAS